MKIKTTCESRMTLNIALVGSLIIAMVLPVRASSEIEPRGTNIGAVRFDAVIELNRYSSRSPRHDYTMMFARYWVSPDYYSAAVVWAEPKSTDLYFAVAEPQSLTVASDEHGFDVCHDSIKKDKETHKKPLGERGALRHRFGVYPIANIRFAQQEALAERVYAADLRNMEDANQPGDGTLAPSIPATVGGDARDVARLRVRSNAERIDSMQLFNAEQRMLKDISYEYESKEGKTSLRRQTVVLPARPMMVGFNGKGMKVTLDGKEYWYKELEATHHGGGRTCTVEYEPVRLGDKEVTLPVKVTVRNGKDGRILRCVRMMNFKQVELGAASAEEAAKQFSGFTADEHKYWQLREKYWDKSPTQIEKEDVESIEQLRARTEKDALIADASTGEELKHLNILMELSRIVGDESGLERHYQSYLSALGESNLPQMTLVGGYGVMETSMFRGRCGEGQKLLSLWVNAVLDMHGVESILLFARRQLAKKRLWTTAVLLEEFSNRRQLSADARFGAEALRCSALGELCKLLRTNNIAEKGLLAKAQADWVASIDKGNLDRMLADSMDQAKRWFAELPEPTESEQALKERLGKTDKEMNRSENK